jgi:hypothetical protein
MRETLGLLPEQAQLPRKTSSARRISDAQLKIQIEETKAVSRAPNKQLREAARSLRGFGFDCAKLGGGGKDIWRADLDRMILIGAHG